MLSLALRIACVAALFFAAVAPAAAQINEVKLTVRRGRTLNLETQVKTESRFEWLYAGIGDIDLNPDTSGTKAIFIAPFPWPDDPKPPNDFSVICIGNVLQTTKDGKTVGIIVGTHFKIHVTDPKPNPDPPTPPAPPGPKPPIPPDPPGPTPIPAPDAALTLKFTDALASDVKAGLGTKEHAQGLAKAYGETADLMRAVSDPALQPKTWAILVARTLNVSIQKHVPRQPFLQSVRAVCSEVLGSYQDETPLDRAKILEFMDKYSRIFSSLSEAAK